MPFALPNNWNAIYAGMDGYFFGTEPSQIARTALRFFQAFGGDPHAAAALDLGSGEGRDTAFLAGAGLHVSAYDVSPAGLEKTRALLSGRGILEDRVQLVQADISAFHYPVAAFDIALAANVYQFLPPDDVPSHIRRLGAATKPGGLCAVGVFSPAMQAWGADTQNYFTASADDLVAYFPADAGWLLLDRTDYWTYRVADETRMSFAYVVAQKGHAQ